METIEEVLEYLEFAGTAEYYTLRLFSELDHLDQEINLSIWTEEDKDRLKERLIECRENMLRNNLKVYINARKNDKVPKERFWWYMDEL